MKAKLVKDIMESYEEEFDELVVTADQSIDELISMIQVADEMISHRKGFLPHPAPVYKKARAKALKYLKTTHHLTREEIQHALTEAKKEEGEKINEEFNVLVWSRKHLPPEVAEDIEKALDGEFGEDLEKSLLKAANNKEDLLTWYNKNFEVGEI